MNEFKIGDKVKFIKEAEYDSTPEESRSTFTVIPVGSIATVVDVDKYGQPELELGDEFDNDSTYVDEKDDEGNPVLEIIKE
jgi:hypothetical protein